MVNNQTQLGFEVGERRKDKKIREEYSVEEIERKSCGGAKEEACPDGWMMHRPVSLSLSHSLTRNSFDALGENQDPSKLIISLLVQIHRD